jgi:uncharacterized protein (DUF305 family)
MIRPRALIAVAGLALIGLALGLGFLLGERSVQMPAGPGPVDIGFSQDMSTHHSQAIEMADLVASNPDQAVSAMAGRIKAEQLEDLGRMQGFLALWDQPTIPTGPPMSWMDHSTHDTSMPGMTMPARFTGESAMPGLATQAQLARLRTLTGNAQAILFLQLMLRHHEGGIEMSDDAAHHAVLPAVTGLAARMSFDQQQENQILTQLLVACGVDPRIPPG